MKFDYWMMMEIIEVDDYRERCKLMAEYEEYILTSKVIE